MKWIMSIISKVKFMNWITTKISSILEFRTEGFIYSLGACSSLFSPFIVLLCVWGWITNSHHGFTPNILDMAFYEIILMIVAGMWSLASIYFILANSEESSKVSLELKKYKEKESREHMITLGEPPFSYD